MTAVWAGIDSGKRAHHCVVIDAMGRTLVSRRVVNDESALLELIAAVLALGGGDQVVWATDLNAGGAALLIALLADRGQQVLYIPAGSCTTRPRPTAVTARRTRKTPGSSPIKPGCVSICSRCAAGTRSAPICGCSRPGAPIWSVTGSGRSTGYEPPCWSTSQRWRRRSTIPRRLR